MGENARVTVEEIAPPMHWPSVVAVWAATAIGAALVGVFAGPDFYLGWLGIAMAASILIAMCVQLGTQEKRGFVARLSTTVAGSFVVLVIATIVLFFAHL